MKNYLSKVACLVLVLGLILGSVGQAFAASASDDGKDVASGNYTYWLINEVSTSSSGATAFALISCNEGAVPAGYMQVNARLYNGNGILSKTSGWTVHNTKEKIIYATSPEATLNGGYYARSQAKTYHGDGYDTRTYLRTPTIQLNKSMSLTLGDENFTTDNPYGVNAKGQTYGSELYADISGIQPDLVAAIGIDGTIGYVYDRDLNPEVNTPEEALAMETIKEIPLYDHDGETVIGTFAIGY